MSTDLALPFRIRGDLLVQRQSAGDGVRWVVKDPISNRFFEFRDHEYRLLQMLDGQVTMREIEQAFQREYGMDAISLPALKDFLAGLHASGIVLCDVPGEGARLSRRKQDRLVEARLQQVFNLLCIRFRGIDPNWMLERLLRACPWLFSKTFVISSMLLMLIAISIVSVHFDSVLARLPEMSAFLGVTNLVWLVLAISLTKVLHEFGHAIVCRRFGGECHDMGLMLLVFAPCLYCDVSDSWMLPSRWSRMAVAGAGIFVDLLVASVCTLLWWFSHPGWFNSWCLNLMCVCSVATLVFNANPLLRYDGYFMLSDAVAIPNMMQEAAARLRQTLLRLMLGLRDVRSRAFPGWRSGFLVVFAVLSTLYRCVLLFAIYRLVHAGLKPYGLERIADVLGVIMLLGVMRSGLRSAASFQREVRERRHVRPIRMVVSMGVLAALTGIVLFLPVSRTIKATAFVELADGEDLYLGTDGILQDARPPGGGVESHQQIARFDAPQLRATAAALQTSLIRAEARIAAIEAQRFDLERSVSELPELRETRRALAKQLQELQTKLDALELSAHNGGILVDPPHKLNADPDRDALPEWSGVPLDRRNANVSLAAGTLVARIGNPGQFEVRIAFPEQDLLDVEIGQRVDLVCEQYPHRTLAGEIVEISRLSVDERRIREFLLWKLPIQFQAEGGPRLGDVYYEARVKLLTSEPQLRVYAPGVARIHVTPIPIGERVVRFIASTFRSLE